MSLALVAAIGTPSPAQERLSVGAAGGDAHRDTPRGCERPAKLEPGVKSRDDLRGLRVREFIRAKWGGRHEETNCTVATRRALKNNVPANVFRLCMRSVFAEHFTEPGGQCSSFSAPLHVCLALRTIERPKRALVRSVPSIEIRPTLHFDYRGFLAPWMHGRAVRFI
jgi:hypothetical protein